MFEPSGQGYATGDAAKCCKLHTIFNTHRCTMRFQHTIFSDALLLQDRQKTCPKALRAPQRVHVILPWLSTVDCGHMMDGKYKKIVVLHILSEISFRSTVTSVTEEVKRPERYR